MKGPKGTRWPGTFTAACTLLSLYPFSHQVPQLPFTGTQPSPHSHVQLPLTATSPLPATPARCCPPGSCTVPLPCPRQPGDTQFHLDFALSLTSCLSPGGQARTAHALRAHTPGSAPARGRDCTWLCIQPRDRAVCAILGQSLESAIIYPAVLVGRVPAPRSSATHGYVLLLPAGVKQSWPGNWVGTVCWDYFGPINPSSL